MSYNVGKYLAERLHQLGIKDHFAVAGDYNLVLLDQLVEHKGLRQVYACNELNCGFDAEGYARANGAGVAVVTFSVGAISAMNSGLGGAYAEHLPVLVVSGGPNSNDYGSGRILHHTIGTTSYDYQLEMAKHVTVAAERITSAAEAPEKIDHVLRTMLREKRPVYLEISCNISNAACPAPGPIGDVLPAIPSCSTSLTAAVKDSVDFLNKAENVVIIVGQNVRANEAEEATVALADKMGSAVTVMAGAKSYFPETHKNFRGVYWGEVSCPKSVNDLVQKADAVITVGPVWNDYSSTGWTGVVEGEKVLQIDEQRVLVGNKSYANLSLKQFVEALAKSAPSKPKSAQNSERYELKLPVADASAPLKTDEVARQVHNEILNEPDGKVTLYAETGDSWVNAIRMNLPEGARVESEMQWGHIGWSIPSGFGYAIGTEGKRRTIIMVGDGSFQLTAQEVGQMIRYNLPVTVILMDNFSYGIEVAIHDGPYNFIQNWDYAKLIDSFNGMKGHDDNIVMDAVDGKPAKIEGKKGSSGIGITVKTGGELAEALKKAKANKHGPTFIQCVLESGGKDLTNSLKEWGKFVAKANARKPVKDL